MIRYITALSNILFKPLRVHQLPLHIQLEFTTYCNLNCKPCLRSKLLKKSPEHLSPQNFKRIIEPIRPSKLSLSGGGEPFLSPYLFELIGLAKELGCSVNTTTNGTLLTPESCVGIIKSGLDLLKISIDGATPETYRKIRGEDRFWQVLDGVQTLIDMKKRMSSSRPYIRFNYVVSKDNYAELAQTVELAGKLGVDAMYFQPLGLFGIEERHEALVGDLTYEALAQEMDRALHVSQHRSVHTNLHVFSHKLSLYWKKYQLEALGQKKQICLLPWFSAYITLEGDMRPCCTCLQEYTTMGNLLETPLEEIWNGKRYQQFRKAIREGKRPFPVCETCVPQTFADIVRYSKILPGFLK